MNKKQRQGALGADLLGFLLVIGGSFLGLLVILALWHGTPQAGASGTGAVARRVVLALGHAPALLLSLGVAAVGVRVYLGGLYDRMPRDLSGLLGTSAGLAILLGALSPSAGGGLGAATGGFLAHYLTTVPALLLGLAAFVMPIWLTWLRDLEILGAKQRRANSLLTVTKERRGVAGSGRSAERETSVSPEEAQALLPDGSAQAVPARASQHTIEELLAGGAPAWAGKNESQHPYPEDPRLKGQIPAGAAPLEHTAAGSASRARVKTSAPKRWTPQREPTSHDAADEDLAVGAFRPTAPVDESDGARDGSADPVGEMAEAAVQRIDPSTPRPSWEAERDDLESVDVPGEFEGDGSREGGATAANANLWRPEGVDEDEDLEDEEGEWEYEDVSDLEEELEEDEGEAEAEPGLAAELDEDDEEETDEEEFEYVEVGEGEELDDEGWEYEYVEVDEDEDDEDDELVALAEDSEEVDDDAGTPQAPAPEPDEAEPATVLTAALPQTGADGQQMDLFADPEDAADAAEAAAAVRGAEPVVVLEPQAPPAGLASENARRAAEVILAESRVAVSLLQRKFGMDFKESCAVLDELQDLGFIGPYIDGKQRDILMGREEWLSAVGTG